MIARRIKVVAVDEGEIVSPEGWEAPTGWRIVHSERVDKPTRPFYRVTLCKTP